jgi:hypothetical protein
MPTCRKSALDRLTMISQRLSERRRPHAPSASGRRCFGAHRWRSRRSRARVSTALGFDAAGALTTYSPASAVTSAANVTVTQSGSGLASTTVAVQLQKCDFFESISALKAWSGPTDRTVAFVRGYYAAGDGGGGIYYYDSSSSATDNGGTIIIPTAAPATGRWLRRYDAHQYSVMVFGAKGDGSTDDSAKFQAAHDALTAYGDTIILPVPTSSYKLSSAVSITKRCKWLGLGKLAVPIICGASNNAFTATFTGGYLDFENLYIQGAASTGTTGSAINAVGTDDSNHMSFVRVVNCYIKDFSAPIVTKYADHIYLQDIFVAQTISGVVTGPVIKHSFGTGIIWQGVTMSGAGATLPVLAARIGSNVDTFLATDCNLYHCGGITVDNVEAGTTFAPRYIRFNDVFVESGKSSDQFNDTCFTVQGGNDVIFSNCTALSGYYGLITNGGTVILVNGGSFYLNQQHGIFVNAGTDVHIDGAMIYDNSQATTNTYRGIIVAAGNTKFSIKNCSIRSQARSGSGNKMIYGITIQNNCTNFEVQNNMLANFGTAAWNLGTGHTGYVYSGNRVETDVLQGAFTCAAAASTTVNNKNIHPYSVVTILATNAGAAGLTGVYNSARVNDTSFTIAHSAGAGTETFNYVLQS